MSAEVYDFRSDNVGGVAPELLEALLAQTAERLPRTATTTARTR